MPYKNMWVAKKKSTRKKFSDSHADTKLLYHLRRGDEFRFQNKSSVYKVRSCDGDTCIYYNKKTGADYRLYGGDMRKKVIVL